MELAEKILNKHLDVTLFTKQHKKLKFWILLAMEEYAKEKSNKLEKLVMPKTEESVKEDIIKCEHKNKIYEPGYFVDDYYCGDCGKEL